MVPLLICCSLLLLLWDSVFALCYVMHCFVSFLVFNHLYERERERERERELFAPLCLPSLCLVIVMWLFLMKLWVCLRCVIVEFPGHTRLYFFAFII